MNWTTKLVKTTMIDPQTGESLYVQTIIRPRWYWKIQRIKLFLSIVWRPYETWRIDWKTAWDVSKVAEGLS